MAEDLPDMEKLLLQFMDGELSQEASDDVQKKLDTDDKWRATAEKLSVTVNAVRYFGVAQEVAAVHRQMAKEAFFTESASKPKIISIRRVIRVTTAVAASILLVIAGIKGYQFYKLSPDKIYDETFVAYQLPVARGNSEAKTAALKEAYKAKDYKQVVTAGKKYKETTAEESFLIGISYLQLADPLSAIKWLVPVATNGGGGAFRPDAEFYLALAYLKNKDYDKSIELMQKINNDPTHPYKHQFSEQSITEVKLLKWK